MVSMKVPAPKLPTLYKGIITGVLVSLPTFALFHQLISSLYASHSALPSDPPFTSRKVELEFAEVIYQWICRVNDLKNKSLVVYSIGSNGDASFEYDMWRTFGATTHTFDPTLSKKVEQRMKKLQHVEFHKIGLTHEDNLSGALSKLKRAVRGSRMMRIEQIMSMLNHTFIDVFKIDCEGCEVQVMRRVAREHPRDKPIFGQVLMELHEFGKTAGKAKMMKTMEEMGYRLFHTEPNYMCKSCFELAYIHESLLRY